MDNGGQNFDPSFNDMKWKGQTKEIDEKNVRVDIVSPTTDENIDPGKVNTEGKTLSSAPPWLTLYHEVGGHGNLKYVEKNPDQKGLSVDYENKIRSFHGMELRGYDSQHPRPAPKAK